MTVLTRRSFAITTLTAGFALAARPVAAETITTPADGLDAGEIQIPVSDGKIPGYRARPAGGKAESVILVTQEIFGVHEHIKDICRRLAKLGHYAIAPSLYARQGDPTQVTDIQKIVTDIVSKVPDDEVMSDLDATVAFAKGENADTGKMGIIGFCWGGRIVWLYAAHNPNLKAAVAFYGPLIRPTDQLRPKNPIDVVGDLKCPVLGLYGGKDQGISIDSIDKMRAALAASKSQSRIDVYPDAPHGFFADYRDSYTPDAATDAWTKANSWFQTNGIA